MTRRSRSPAKPHARKKAARRAAVAAAAPSNYELSPWHLWAARITKRILVDCHPWQRDAVIDPARRISMIVGRGGAKTTTERARALIKMLWLRNQYIGYAATSKEHARILNWDKLKQACENYGIRASGDDPDVTFLESKLLMQCHRTGTVYQLRGVEDVSDAEKFRGFPQTEFQIDECGSFKPELFVYLLDQCVSPRLGEALALPPGLLEFLLDWDPEDEDALAAFLAPIVWEDHRGGCLVLASTPPRRIGGEFYDVTRDGSPRHRPYAKRNEPHYKGWLGYSSHFWTLADVVSLPRARELYPALVYNWEEALRTKAEKQWSDENPIWKREYLALWAADDTDTTFKYRPHVNGEEWNIWNPLGWPNSPDAARTMLLRELREILDKLEAEFGDVRCVIAADKGFSDNYGVNVFAFSPRDATRRIWHSYGFERQGMYAKLVAELLLGEQEVQQIVATGVHPHKYGGVFGTIGRWPDGLVLDGDDSHIAELKNVYGIQFVKADRKPDSKVGAIEEANGDLVDGRIKILKDTPLEKQIRVLQWKEDDFGQKKEDKAQANHSTDCLVYGRKLISNLFESGVVVQEAQQSAPKPAETYRDPMGLDPGIVPDEGDEEEGLLASSEWHDDDEDWG